MKLPKTEWGDGPWQSEPDEHTWEHRGLPCVILRVPEVGHLCGYVVLPQGHPWEGKGYDDIEADVHGGLTFAGRMHAHPERWAVGFDCAHLGDFTPGTEALLREVRKLEPRAAQLMAPMLPDPFGRSDTYRTLDYVRSETERLAEQAEEAAKGAAFPLPDAELPKR